jgi:hypothetical protein
VDGDGKMSAFGIRCDLVGKRQYVLSPLPLTGATAQQMPQGVSQGIAKGETGEWESMVKSNEPGQEVEGAHGYEIKRVCEVNDPAGPWQWPERVLVIRPLAQAQKQAGGLEPRLTSVESKIRALTPS